MTNYGGRITVTVVIKHLFPASRPTELRNYGDSRHKAPIAGKSPHKKAFNIGFRLLGLRGAARSRGLFPIVGPLNRHSGDRARQPCTANIRNIRRRPRPVRLAILKVTKPPPKAAEVAKLRQLKALLSEVEGHVLSLSKGRLGTASWLGKWCRLQDSNL